MEFLFAPTVPSEPSPQNLQETVPFGVVLGAISIGSERFVTSSLMLIVKPFTGFAASRFLYVAIIAAGVVSFEPSPYLPPTIIQSLKRVLRTAFTTSRYRGSPIAPGSFVLSSTAIFFTVSGRAAIKRSIAKGR